MLRLLQLLSLQSCSDATGLLECTPDGAAGTAELIICIMLFLQQLAKSQC